MNNTYEDVLAVARELSADDKAQLVEALQRELTEAESRSKTPKRSLLGLFADLGTAPSAEEIDEARREMWANFPREDI